MNNLRPEVLKHARTQNAAPLHALMSRQPWSRSPGVTLVNASLPGGLRCPLSCSPRGIGDPSPTPLFFSSPNGGRHVWVEFFFLLLFFFFFFLESISVRLGYRTFIYCYWLVTGLSRDCIVSNWRESEGRADPTARTEALGHEQAHETRLCLYRTPLSHVF
jgi:hypothetical protein